MPARPLPKSCRRSRWRWCCLPVLFQLVTACSHRTTFPVPEEAKARIAEITAVQPGFFFPTPDGAGKYLAFVRAVGPGRRLFLLDLASGDLQQVPVTNEVTEIYGWSPDNRRLAFLQAPPLTTRTDGSLTAAWVTWFEPATGIIQRIGNKTDAYEGSAAWLGNQTIFFSTRPSRSEFTEKFIVDIGEHMARKMRNYLNEFTLASSNTAVYFGEGNLQSCRLDTTNYPPVRPLTHFPAGEFVQFNWLRYRAAPPACLFCARRTNDDWRCLYEFAPDTGQLRQLTTQYTYNGQFLGQGFAFVANTNNEFYLALRPADPALATNLFCGGNVVTYRAAPAGDKVYVVASAQAEPPSLWEYNLAARRLRKLVDGQPAPWQKARLVTPQEFSTASFDGLKIPCFVLPPAELTDHPSSTKKFPVIFYLPPVTAQFQRSFDLPAEVYANLNCWVVAVNYRGVDGYGQACNNRYTITDAAQDALAVLNQFEERDQVDAQRVVLVSESNGADVAMELLKTSAIYWRAAVLRHPNILPDDAHLFSADTPPLFVVTGGLERFAPGVQKFAAALGQMGLSARFHIQTNSWHVVWSTDQIRDTMEQEADFVRLNLN